MPFDADRWAALGPDIDQLLQLSADERGPWLDAIAVADPPRATRLRELLAARDAASAASFLGGVAAPGVLPSGPRPGEVLGAWTLVEAIGEGGMGSVWRARRTDGRFEGEAAIKLLRSGLFHSSAQVRFRHEGAILAKLRHPGIAQLLDAGISERGQPYLILEFVAGARIDQWCDARALSIHRRVDLVARAADAVASAHAQLVIHRDLKPSNILVTERGDPKLLDFGIARLVSDDGTAGLTREGSFALTPEYAAPEQFSHETLSVATDIYALGILLHELLVGVHPSGLLRGAPLDYMSAAIRGTAAPPSEMCERNYPSGPSPLARAGARGTTPRLLARALTGDLDHVVAKALATRPGDRYASAQEFAQDLRRYLASEPVSARRPEFGYRFRKLLRRRPVESALVAGVALALALGMAATVWQWRIAEAQRREAQQQRARAERMLARALVANDFTHNLMTELAQVTRPVRFMDVLEQGERLASTESGGDPAQRAHVLLEIADFRLTGDDTARGGPLAERAAAIALAAGDRPLAAIAICEHAVALAEQGRADAAGVEVRRALTLAGDDPEAMAKCFIARGWSATAVGRSAEALDSARRASQYQSRMPWTSPATRVELLDLTGTAETLAGDYAQSERDFRAAITLLERAGRGRSLQAATVWNNLANDYDNAGRLAEGVDAYRRTLRIQRDILGDDGVAVAVWTNLGRALVRLNEFDEAWAMTERGLARARVVHDEVAQFYGPLTLANVRREQRRFAQARELLAEAVHHLGDEGPGSMMRSSLDLARVREDLAEGRAADALERLDRLQADIGAYDLDKHSHDVSDVFFQTLLAVRAEVCAALGRLPEALAVSRQALALARRQQGPSPGSANTASALAAVARLEALAGHRDVAVAIAREAEPQLVASYGDRHPLTREVRALGGRIPPP